MGVAAAVTGVVHNPVLGQHREAPILQSERMKAPIEIPAALRREAGDAGVVSYQQLRRHFDSRQILRLVGAGALVRVGRNGYLFTDERYLTLPPWADHVSKSDRQVLRQRRQSLRHLQAADLSMPSPAVACLHSAAAIYGFDVEGDDRTHVLSPGSHHGAEDLLMLHRPKLLRPLWDVDGRRVTDPTETAIAIAASLTSEYRAMGVLDRAVRSLATDQFELRHYASESRIRGIRQVRPLLDLIDRGAESPPESWTRLACIRFGLPRPVTQVKIVGKNGRTYFLDLAWPEFRVGLEYDGADFHSGENLGGDRRRLNSVTGNRWTIFSMTSQAWWNYRDEVLGQVRDAIAAAS